MTSVADQDTRRLGGPLSILTRQKRDHQRLGALLQRLERGEPVIEEQATLQDIARLDLPGRA